MNGDIQLLAIQMTSSPNIEENFTTVKQQLILWQQSAQYQANLPTLVVLPECFAIFGGIDGSMIMAKEVIGDPTAPIQAGCREIAQQFGVWLIAGTIPTDCGLKDKYHATALIYSPQGQLVNHYQKIHLFDVDVTDSTGSYRESDTTVAGERVVLFELQGITVGLAVCYDVRFPGLFQLLAEKGAQIVVLPSAFTCPTGHAHWHSLIRARAIENQVYMVAAAQAGVHQNHRETFGHSMIVDPWGEVIEELNQSGGHKEGQIDGYVCGLYQSERVSKVRANMPLKQHNRFKYELIDESICRA